MSSSFHSFSPCSLSSSSSSTSSRVTTTKSSAEPLFLAFVGKIGAGKTTAAKNVAEAFKKKGYVVHSLHFAAYVKRAVAGLLGVSYDFVTSREGKQMFVPHFGMTIGRLLQVHAEFYRRQFGDDIYNEMVEHDVQHILQTPLFGPKKLVFIFDDARYFNDLDYLVKKENHLIVLLEGDPAGEYANLKDERDKQGKSETDFLQFSAFDLTINTNENSREEVENIVLDYLKK